MNTGPESNLTVGLVTIATGRYTEFVPALVASARQHLVGLGPVFVLSDADVIDADVTLLPWGHMPWPLPTLLRYRAFGQYAEALSSVDMLLYTDADMLFVDTVDIRNATGLIAVQHPGFVHAPTAELPYERRAASTAHVARGEEGSYFCGGVQGGRTDAYLAAAAAIDAAIATDQANEVTAVWHDESQWNRYLLDHPAAMQLDSTYCTPDVNRTPATKILAITKDHAYFRELSVLQRGQHLVNRMLFSARLRARRVKHRIAGPSIGS